MFLRLLRLNLVNKNKINIKIIDNQQFCRYFSSSKNNSEDKKTIIPLDIPENFYDEELESDEVYQDLVKSLESGGLGKLTSINYNQIQNDEALNSSDQDDDADVTAADDFDDDNTIDDDDYNYDEGIVEYSEEDQERIMNDPLVAHDYMENMEISDDPYRKVNIFPAERLDFNIQWKVDKVIPDPLVHKFISRKSKDKVSLNSQQSRACPGKLQRHGKSSPLKCHLIDIDKLTYIDIVTLHNFMTDDAEILGRKGTGLCAKCQRKVAKTIKTSRNFGLIPHIGEFDLSESRPLYKKKIFHENSSKIIHRVVSKTIL